MKPLAQPEPTAARALRRQAIYGFVSAAGIFASAYSFPRSPKPGTIFPYLLAITVIPLLAVVLSIIPKTRRFGLGMLLGCGAIWLIMLAICGGAFR